MRVTKTDHSGHRVSIARLASAFLVPVAALAFGVSNASAHAGHSHDGGGHPTEQGFTELPENDPERGLIYDGLEVATAGPCRGLLTPKNPAPDSRDLCTHGPDPTPAFPPALNAAAPLLPIQDRMIGLSNPLAQCDGDGVTGPRVQVVYARASDRPNRFTNAAVLKRLRVGASYADETIRVSGLRTGADRRIRFVHDGACRVTIENAIIAPSEDNEFGATANALDALGFNRTDRKYLVFLDTASTDERCGQGEISPHDIRQTNNLNNHGPSIAIVFSGCWDPEDNAISVGAHELLHNLGAVQLSAPNTSGGYHCVDEHDLMCYSDEPNFPQMVTRCPTADRELADCNHDDYFSTGPDLGYLANHWNAADNQFLIGARPVPVAPLPETTVTASRTCNYGLLNEGDFTNCPALRFFPDSPNYPNESSFDISIDNGSWINETGLWIDRTFADGYHTVAIRASVQLVGVDPTPFVIHFTVDTVPPETNIVSGPMNGQTVLTASQSFAFTSVDNGAVDWTTTYQCAYGAASFTSCTNPYFRSYTANGSASFKVRATDLAGNVDPTPAQRDFTVAASSVAIGVNFQPTGTTPPPGFIAHTGAMYASSGGYAHGWSVPPAASIKRNAPNSPNVLYDTFTPMQFDASSNPRNDQRWQIGVPNGTYRVRVVAGDPTAYNSVYKIDVEGVLTIDGTPSATRLWLEGVRNVLVSDGRLTISNATGAVNNKLAFVEIKPSSVDPPDTSITSGPVQDSNTFTATPSFAFSSTTPGATFECQIATPTATPSGYAPCGETYTTPPLVNGRHVLSVRAVDASGNVDQSPVSRAFHVAASSTNVKINFQPTGASVPAGYLKDSGSNFANRGNGYAYGWICDESDAPGAFFDRNATNSPDQRYDTLAALDLFCGDGTSLGYWVMAVPNGTYTVHAVAGDPIAWNSIYRFDLNGVPIINETPTSSNRWIEGTRTVVVDNGYLSIMKGTGAVNNKLAFVEVAPASISPPDTSITSGPAQNSTVYTATPSFTFAATTANPAFECQLDGGSFTSCSSSYTTPALANGTHTLAVRATDAIGNVDQTSVSRTFLVASTATTMRVNFQPAAAPAPPGYLIDSGGWFGPRNGYQYGWICDETDSSGAFFDRNAANSPDQRYDTFAALDLFCGDSPYGTSFGAWTIAVPNGTYTVHAVAGDPIAWDSVFRFSVEGVPIIDGTPTFSSRWIEGTRTVIVDDGLLGLSEMTGAVNSKLAYVEITPSAIEPPDTSITVGPASEAVVNTATPTFTFASTTPGSTFECQIATPTTSPSGFTPCGSTYTTPTLFNGRHTISVRAVDAGGNIDQTPIERTFHVAANSTNIKINFQPSGASVPAGYLKDSGSNFANRGEGYAYGWICDETDAPGAFFDRNAANSPDQRYDSFAALDLFCGDGTPFGAWVMAVPNGVYTVHAVAGDPIAWNSVYKFDLDGVRIIDGVPTSANRWIEGTRTVIVDDGYLGIGNATGAVNNKLAYIDIAPATISPPDTSIVDGPAQDATVFSATPTFAFASTAPGSIYECRITTPVATGASFAPCGSSYTTPTLFNGVHTLEVRAIDTTGNVDQTPASRKFNVEASSTNVKINFQPAGSQVPSGFLKDSGSNFASRGNGYAYGWVCDEGDAAWAFFDRNAANSPDQQHDTFAALDLFCEEGAPIGSWVMAVPNGTYTVRAVAGDPIAWDSIYKFDLNGVRIIDGTPTSSNRWLEGTRTVVVDNGYLGITANHAAFNSKLAFVEIAPASVNPPDTSIASGPAPDETVNTATPTFAFTATTANPAFECQLDEGAFTICPTTYTTPALSNGRHTLAVRAIDASGNIDQSPATRMFSTVANPLTMRVNFQPTGAPAPPGYLIDSGASFGPRNGYQYGWTCDDSDAPGAFFDRNAANSPDQRYDTFAALDLFCGDSSFGLPFGAWAIAVPNGTYTVHVVAGDPTAWNSVYQFAVDGVPIVDGTPTSSNPWVEGTRTVVIDDGYLGFTEMQGAVNNKLAFVEITPSAINPPDTTITSGPAEGTTVYTTTASFSFTADIPGSTFECKLSTPTIETASFAPCDSSYTTPVMVNGPHVLEVRATDPSGNVDQTVAKRSFGMASSPTTARVNFQPTSAATPPGFMRDSGAFYGNRGNGYAYGWICDESDAQNAFVDRNSPSSPDQRYDTFATIDLFCGDSPIGVGFGVWTIAVPNGTYTVHAAAGDATSWNSFYKFDVNGQPLISGVPGPSSPWVEGTRSVRVTDGRIGIFSANDAINNKLAFVEITPSTTDPLAPSIQYPVGGSALSSTSLSVSFSARGATECSLDGQQPQACTSPWAISGLGNGWHTVSVRTTGSAGNGGDVESVRFEVDTGDPDTAIDYGPAEGSSIASNDATFEFSSGDQEAIFECQVDGEVFAACDSPFRTPYLAAGPHSFSVRSVDRAGNPDPQPARRNFNVDVSAPVVTILAPANGSTHPPGSINVDFSADKPAVFQCSMDGSPFSSCAPLNTYSGLAAGTHTLSIKATAPLGAWSVATTTFMVAYPAYAYVAGGVLKFRPGTVTETHDIGIERGDDVLVLSDPGVGVSAGSGCLEQGATVECDAAIIESVSVQTQTGDDEIHVNVDLPAQVETDAGADVVRTLGGDDIVISGAGGDDVDTGGGSDWIDGQSENDVLEGGPGADEVLGGTGDDSIVIRDGSTDTVTCGDDIDTVASDQIDRPTLGGDCESITDEPDTSIVAGPENDFVSPEAIVEFSQASDWIGAGFQCRFDSDQFATCGSTNVSGAQGDGPHSYEVRAIDQYGNIDLTPATRSFIVDTTAPQVAISEPVNESLTSESPVVGFSVTDANVGVSECNLDNGPFGPCPAILGPLTDGLHTVTVRNTDAAGNAGQASSTFTVDTTDPQVSIDSPADNTYVPTSTPTLTLRLTEANPATTECQLDGGAWGACHATLGPLEDGQHTVAVRHTDSAERTGQDVNTFTVDTAAPQVAISSPASGATSSSTPTLAYQLTEANPATTDCRMDGGAWGTCPATLGPLSDGAHAVAVRHTDLAGNVNQATSSFTVATPVDTKIDAGPAAGSTIDDQTATFTFHGIPPSQTGSFDCQVDAGAWSACGTGSSATFTTPVLAVGTHTFGVRAKNLSGSPDPSPATRTFNVALPGLNSAATPVTTPATVNLTTEGPVDWAHWGTTANSITPHRKSGTQYIRNWSLLGTGTITRVASGVPTYDWTNGEAPYAAAPTPKTTAIYTGSLQNRGFHLEFDASTENARVAKLALGALNATGTITASMSDGSALTSTKTIATTSTTIPKHNYISITYRGGTPGAKLLVDYKQTTTGTATTSRVYLHSAALLDAVDVTQPDTTISAGVAEDGIVTTATTAFSFTANESSTFQCKLDNGAYTTCTSPYTTPSMADGKHTFKVRAQDVFGNVDASPAVRNFWVSRSAGILQEGTKLTAPAATPLNLTALGTSGWAHWGTGTSTTESILLAPTRKSGTTSSVISNATRQGSVVATRPPSSGIPQTTWNGSGDPAGSPTTTAIQTGANATTSGFTFSIAAPNTVTRTANIYIGAINTTAKLTLSLSDGSAMTVIDTAAVTAGSTAVNMMVPVTFRAANAGATLSVVLVQNVANSAGKVYLHSVALVDGTDATPPTTTFGASPANLGVLTGNTATFSFTVNEVGTSSKCSLDGAAWATCSSPYTTPAMAAGAHTIDIRSTDAAGNAEPRPPRRIVIVQ